MALIFLSELRVHNSFSMPLILDLRHLNSCLTLPFFLNISQIFRGQTRPYYGRNSQYFLEITDVIIFFQSITVSSA